LQATDSGYDQLQAAGKEQYGYAHGAEALILGMAVRVIPVRRTGGQAYPHQADDIGGAVEKGMQAVCAHGECNGVKTVDPLGQSGEYVEDEYDHQDATDGIIVGHAVLYGWEAINNYGEDLIPSYDGHGHPEFSCKNGRGQK